VVLLCVRDKELRLRSGASHSDEEVAAGGRSGMLWRARGRPTGERKEVRAGRWRDGGGRAAARGAALLAAGEQSRGGTCARKKKRGEEVRGTYLKFPESSRSSW
jgi:hypothetical protein